MIRDPSGELLARRRSAAERLRRALQRADGSLSHPYFRAYRKHARSVRGTASLDRVFRSCAAARVTCIGDFHAVPAYQTFAARVLHECVARSRAPYGLGVEFAFTRQQGWLDLRQDGALSDDEFLRRIHYREEWGYPWDGLRDLLDAARRASVPVFALDASPRSGLAGVRRRDAHAARRVATVLARNPGMRMLVLFGESHLAPSHLPGRIARRLGRDGVGGRVVTVLQNPDEPYWSLAARERPPAAVRLQGDSWAVFHTSPLAKYEAYRQLLERWQDDVPPEDEVDLTPAVHHLVDVLLGWLGIRRQRSVRHRAGWSEPLEDAYPEVYSGVEAHDLLPDVLRQHGRARDEIREARTLLEERGVIYDSRSNAVFLARYLPGRAAGAGARFLRTALTGRLFVPSGTISDDPAERAYGAAYNEALAYLGSRLVDPASDYLSGEDLRALRVGAASDVEDPDVRERTRWLEAHARFEASGRSRAPDALLDPLRGPRGRARTLARDLGHRLGRTLYHRVRSGAVRRATLRAWFQRALPPGRAAAVVLRLLREAA